MGMFDTIHFEKEIKCAVCGKAHVSTQTKGFENLMIHYYMGDLVPGRVITGIIEEMIYCDHKDTDHADEPHSYQKICIVLWHRLLIGVVEEAEIGERLINKFGLADLYFLYERLFEKKNDYETKYIKLKKYAEIFSDYLNLSPEEKGNFKNKEDMFISFPHMEVLNHIEDKEPLKRLIEELDSQKFKEKTLF